MTGRDQRGAAAVEVAILVPAMLLFVALLVAGGRLHLARGAVVDAAATGARAASLQTGPGPAVRAAQRITTDHLAGTCDSSTRVNVAEFNRPSGSAAQVHVTVSCDLHFDDVVLPGLPGRISVTATRSHPLDSFRQRG